MYDEMEGQRTLTLRSELAIKDRMEELCQKSTRGGLNGAAHLSAFPSRFELDDDGGRISPQKESEGRGARSDPESSRSSAGLAASCCPPRCRPLVAYATLHPLSLRRQRPPHYSAGSSGREQSHWRYASTPKSSLPTAIGASSAILSKHRVYLIFLSWYPRSSVFFRMSCLMMRRRA